MDSTRDEARRLFDKTRDLLRPIKDGVVRTVEVSSLGLEINRLKRSLDDACRDLGRRAVQALREEGTLRADEVSALLRRIDEVEDRIAEKERQIAEIEREDAAPGS